MLGGDPSPLGGAWGEKGAASLRRPPRAAAGRGGLPGVGRRFCGAKAGAGGVGTR